MLAGLLVAFVAFPLIANMAMAVLEWLNLIDQDGNGTEPARRLAVLMSSLSA